jgi:hypothetical protein
LAVTGFLAERTLGRKGKAYIDEKMAAFNSAARFNPWLVIRDLDQDGSCCELRHLLLPTPAASMCFRIAVRAIESWLLADGEAMATFLDVDLTGVSTEPDSLADPKAAVVRLARKSKRKSIRLGMVPAHGDSSRVGARYSALMIQFAQTNWRPEVAARRSPSLRKCIVRLRQLRSRLAAL